MGHQYITSQAVKHTQTILGNSVDYFDLFKPDSLVTARRLIIGVLYSDAGMCSQVDLKQKIIQIVTTAEHPVPLSSDDVVQVITDDDLRKNKSCKIDYLRQMDERFRCYPSNWESMSLALIGKKTKKNLPAYYLGMNDAFQHVHSMAPNKKLRTISQIIERIVKQAVDWFAAALRHEDAYFIGRIFHMIQDSFSEAHMRRESDGLYTFSICDVYQYNAQNKKHHSEMDSITRLLSNAQKNRLDTVIDICGFVLVLFYERDAVQFQKFIETSVYRIHSKTDRHRIAKNK